MLCNYDSACGERNEMNNRKRCNNCMTGIMVLVGIIAGIIFASITVLLFIFGQLLLVYVGALAAFIIGAVTLFIVLIAALQSENRPKLASCIRCHLGGLFFGILGTLFSGFLAISAILISLSILAVVFVGFTAFFFAFLLVSILFLVICAVDK